MLANAPDNVLEKLLKDATSMYISQHSRILYESMKLFLTSKNKETRKDVLLLHLLGRDIRVAKRVIL